MAPTDRVLMRSATMGATTLTTSPPHSLVVPELGAKNHIFYKTNMCPWLVNNRCYGGSSCNYAHDVSELRPKPNLAKTRMCANIARQGVCTVADCKFAHAAQELREDVAKYTTPSALGRSPCSKTLVPETAKFSEPSRKFSMSRQPKADTNKTVNMSRKPAATFFNGKGWEAGLNSATAMAQDLPPNGRRGPTRQERGANSCRFHDSEALRSGKDRGRSSETRSSSGGDGSYSSRSAHNIQRPAVNCRACVAWPHNTDINSGESMVLDRFSCRRTSKGVLNPAPSSPVSQLDPPFLSNGPPIVSPFSGRSFESVSTFSSLSAPDGQVIVQNDAMHFANHSSERCPASKVSFEAKFEGCAPLAMKSSERVPDSSFPMVPPGPGLVRECDYRRNMEINEKLRMRDLVRCKGVYELGLDVCNCCLGSDNLAMTPASAPGDNTKRSKSSKADSVTTDGGSEASHHNVYDSDDNDYYDSSFGHDSCRARWCQGARSFRNMHDQHRNCKGSNTDSGCNVYRYLCHQSPSSCPHNTFSTKVPLFISFFQYFTADDIIQASPKVYHD